MQYSTRILSCNKQGDCYLVELEECRFYPDGSGGQLGDRGKIGDANVLEVLKSDEAVVLKVDRELELNREYVVEIDENRRFDIAQQHTAQHILTRAFEDLFDLHTVGFHMGEEVSTIDLDTSVIDWNIIEKAENLSNSIIWQDLPVEIILEDYENIKKYNVRKISEKIKDYEKIRLVKIGDFDTNPCGGFHVDRTGKIGMVKVVGFEKVKGKYMRLGYIAGERVLKYIRDFEERERKLFELTKASKNDLIAKIQKLSGESAQAKKKTAFLVEELKDKVVEELINNPIAFENFNLYFYSGITELIEVLASVFQKREGSIFIGFDTLKNSVVITSTVETSGAGDIVREILKVFDGKGGGSKKRANVILTRLTVEDVEKIKNNVVDLLKSEKIDN